MCVWVHCNVSRMPEWNGDKSISPQHFYHLKIFYPIKVVNRLNLWEEINIFHVIHSSPTIPGTVLYLFSAGGTMESPPSSFQGDYVYSKQNKAAENNLMITSWSLGLKFHCTPHQELHKIILILSCRFSDSFGF